MSPSDSLRVAAGRNVDLLAPLAPSRRSPVAPASAPESFASVLENEVAQRKGVRFSAHAMQRLADRNLSISKDDEHRIERSLDLAEQKGGRQTLILVDRLALIANVPNRTIITVTGQDEMQDLVFTNIDTAVVAAEAPSTSGKSAPAATPLDAVQPEHAPRRL